MEGPALDQGSNPAPDRPDNATVASGRRKFLVGAAPFAVTLASRPAFATVCTISVIQSANLSRHESHPTNCGVSPGCWKNLAYKHDKRWDSTNYDPADSFASVFGKPVVDTGNDSVGWNVGAGTLLNALGIGDAPKIWYKRNNGDRTYVPVNSNGFRAQCTAALLNASAFGHSGHYPIISPQLVINYVSTQVWGVILGNSFPASHVTGPVADYFNGFLPSDHECFVEL